MPKTYEVETTDKVYTVEANSEEEARAAVNAQLGNPSSIEGEQPNTGEQPTSTPTGLSKFGQDVAQAITTPQRGLRGVGVGAEKLLEGVNPSFALPGGGTFSGSDAARIASNAPVALERAAAAVQPGYIPQDGEKIGSAIGETIGSAPLALALTPEIAAPGITSSLARYAVKALAAGAGGGAFAAINDASEKGHVDPTDVVLSGGINAIFPIFRPSVSRISSFIRGATDIPLTGTTTLSREAMGELAQDPKLLEHAAGTADAIGSKVENIQRKMIEQLGKIGDKLKKTRLLFNITSPLETPIEQVAKEGIPQKSFQDIAKEFVDLKRGYRVVDKTPKPYYDPFSTSEPYNSVVTPKTKIVNKPISIKDRIKGLYDLRYEIDQNNVIKNKIGAEVQPISTQDIEDRYLKGLRSQVNDLIDELAPQVGGANSLRLMDNAYSQARGLYDRFLKKLSDPAQAEQTLLSIYKKGNPDEIIGLNSDTVDVLRRLERKTGEKYIEPLRKEFASKEFKELKGRGGKNILSLLTTPVGAAFEAAGPGGTAGFLNFINNSSSIMQRIGDIALSRGSQSAALGSTAALKENQ